MWRRSSVVHVVDELARAQRRERCAGRARAAAGRRAVGGCGACASSWAWCSRSPRSSARSPRCSATSAASRRRRRARRRRRGSAGSRSRSCGCCTRCAFGGRGRGRRSTRASRPGRSGARACGRSLACPPATCSTVRVRRGQSVADLDARSEQLAACLRAREVRVLRDPRDAAQASVLIVRRDPFEGAAPDAVAGGRRSRRCRCGSRSRSASTSRASRWRSSWSSATC